MTSIGICFLAYVLLAMFFLFDSSDPEEMMWLPVGLFFICVNYFGMAFPTSASPILFLRFNDIVINGERKEWVAT